MDSLRYSLQSFTCQVSDIFLINFSLKGTLLLGKMLRLVLFQMPVSALKEKIASQIGVPVEQQRLIFRGKVLKDDHLLSEYCTLSMESCDAYARK